MAKNAIDMAIATEEYGAKYFVVNICKKIKEGKPVTEFTKDDWEDAGINTATIQ